MKSAKKGRVLWKPFVRACTTLDKPPPIPPPFQMDPSSKRYCYEPVLRWNPEVERYFSQAYGADHFSRISKALTCPSRYSCIRVNTLQATVDGVMEKLLAVFKDEGANTCGNLLSINNGTAVVPAEEGNKDVSLMKCPIPGLDYVVFVQGSGPNTINYESPSGDRPKEVIVSRKCAEAVIRGAQVFIPGVMACSAHVEKGDRVAVSVAIENRGSSGGWAIPMTRGTVLQGLETDALYLERRGLYIGQGTSTMSRAGLFRAAEGIAVDMDTRVFSLPSLHDVLEGEIFLQNLPSIITAHALDPKRGEKILDMCAAPGGKTTAIAILMKDEGEVIAVDRSHNKVMNIQKRAAEMGLTCIKPYKMDALKSVCERNVPDSVDMVQSFDSLISSEGIVSSSTAKELIPDRMCLQTIEDHNENKNERIYASKALIRKTKRKMKNGPGRNQDVGGRVQQSKGFDPDSFDRVLLDAPCSALGLRPRLFAEEETIESLRKHAKYQRRMFDQAVKLVRSGGVIVYSTCTINPGENEALVRYALDTYKFLSLAPQHPQPGGPGLVGRHESEDGFVEYLAGTFADNSMLFLQGRQSDFHAPAREWLRPGEEHLVQRFDPSSPLDTIGFFIAKFSVGAKDVPVKNEDG